MRAERDDTRPADGRQPREVERCRTATSAIGPPSLTLPKCVAGTWPGQREAQARPSVRPYHALFVKVSERLDEKHPSSSNGWHVCTLPGSLVTRIPEEPHDSSQDQGH